jgi:hypothetical protein
MVRRILAVGSAALLAFTVATTPLSAADIGLPTKAPIYKAEPAVVEEVNYWPWLLAAALVGTGLGICFAECGCLKSCGGPPACSSPPCS